jgi:hypothetical protein
MEIGISGSSRLFQPCRYSGNLKVGSPLYLRKSGLTMQVAANN